MTVKLLDLLQKTRKFEFLMIETMGIKIPDSPDKLDQTTPAQPAPSYPNTRRV
jgi:hypothetical protein